MEDTSLMWSVVTPISVLKIRYEKMNLVCIFETMLCTTVLEFGVAFHCVIAKCLYVCRLMLSM